MPLVFCRDDIVHMAESCDAIVVPTNVRLIPGGGVDWAVHMAAGPSLQEYCQRLGGCAVGEAAISPAYNLPCWHIIHTVPPYWDEGDMTGVLRLCYANSLNRVVENGCKSVAFPLLGAGTCGFPKPLALSAALSVISEFLLSHGDVTVHIVLFDAESLEVAKRLFSVQEYIDDTYALFHGSLEEKQRAFRAQVGENATEEDWQEFRSALIKRYQEAAQIATDLSVNVSVPTKTPHQRVTTHTIVGYIEKNYNRELFLQKLREFLNAKKIDEVECYNRADVSRQTWHKIITTRGYTRYKPTKQTVVALAIAMKLTFEETQILLGTAGYALTEAIKFDVVIAACLKAGVYDRDLINSILLAHDEEILFFKSKEEATVNSELTKRE